MPPSDTKARRKPLPILLLGIATVFLSSTAAGGSGVAADDSGFTWLGRNDAVYSSDVRGRGMRLVTRVPRIDFGWDGVEDFAWSRTGRRLAYVTCASASCLVRVFTSATGKTATLTTSTWAALDPAWAPDEERLAYYNFPTPCSSKCGGYISIVSIRSGHKRVLVAPQARRRDQQPAWSPDGKTIAFVRERIPLEEPQAVFPPAVIHLVGASGRSVRRLTVGRSPDWSPDGKRIAFADQDGIYVIGADGKGRRRVVHSPIDGKLSGFDLHPKWSPDGRTILYGSGDDPETAWTVAADGSRRARVVRVKGFFGPVAWDPDRR
jgi:WD40 repeat protein